MDFTRGFALFLLSALSLFMVVNEPVCASCVSGSSGLGSEFPYLQWSLEWNRTYGGGDRENFRDVVTDDGGYVLAGSIELFGGGYDAWLVKVDSEGVLEWSQTYGGEDRETLWDVVVTGDDGYVLAGYTESYGAGEADFWLVKVDSEGTVEWNQTYGGFDDDEAWSMAATSDGGYIIAGDTRSYAAGKTDVWLVKVDSEGVLEWTQTYGGEDYDGGRSVVETHGGGYLLAGYTKSYGAGGRDAWLVKVDCEGVLEWNRTYGGSKYDTARDVLQTGDGGYVLAGQTESFGAGLYDFWLVKVDCEGVLEWNRTYGGEDYEYLQDAATADDGGYVLTGQTESYSAGKTDAWLVKVDCEGVLETDRAYGGTDWDWGSSVLGIGNGIYVLAGSTSSYGAELSDGWLLKVGLELSGDLTVSDFSSDVVDGSGPLTVSFVDRSESIDRVVSWLWVFGDGSTSRLQNPSHTYTQIGTYTVSLTVTEEDGDSDVETKSRYITVTGTDEMVDRLDVEWTFNTSAVFDDKAFGAGHQGCQTVWDVDGDGVNEVVFGTRWGDSERLWCIDQTGSFEWVYPDIGDEGLPNDPWGVSLVDVNSDGTYELCFSGRGGRLHVLNGDGSELWLWDNPTGAHMLGPPQAHDVDGDGFPEFFMNDAGGFIHRISHEGELVWTSFQAGGANEGHPTIADMDRDGSFEVLWASQDHYLYCVDAATGEEVWRFDSGAKMYTNPVFVADINNDDQFEGLVWNDDPVNSVIAVSASGAEVGRWTELHGSPIRLTPAMGDVDDDGQLEMALMSGAAIYVIDLATMGIEWERDVTQWTRGGLIPGGAVTNTWSNYPLIADIDGDLELEILWLSPYPIVTEAATGRLEYYYSNEHVDVGWRQENGGWWGDVDQDGVSEWIVELNGNSHTETQLYCLTAGGSFPAHSPWPEYVHSAYPAAYQAQQDWITLKGAGSNSVWFPMPEIPAMPWVLLGIALYLMIQADRILLSSGQWRIP